MKLHANAALSLKGRRRMVLEVVERGRTVTEAAEAAGVSERTCSKWVAATGREGEPGLLDRSSAPLRVHNRTDEQTVRLLRRVAAAAVHRPGAGRPAGHAAVDGHGCLETGRDGQARPARSRARSPLRARAARRADPRRRQEARPHQGGAGKRVTGRAHTGPDDRQRRRSSRRDRLDAVHVAIDDATRLAYAEVLPDEKAHTAVGFLAPRDRASSNATASPSSVSSQTTDRPTSPPFTRSPAALGIRHLRTRPYRPQTNGKAERFIRTMLTAGPTAHLQPQARTHRALDGWLYDYNHRRRHQALGRKTPITRLNNLHATYGSTGPRVRRRGNRIVGYHFHAEYDGRSADAGRGPGPLKSTWQAVAGMAMDDKGSSLSAGARFYWS